METPETIFNLFYYSSFELITEVGVVVHTMSGNDDDKLRFLQNNVEKDFLSAIRFPIPDNIKIKVNGVIQNGIDHITYRDYCSKGHGFLIYEAVFQYYNAPQSPLMIITPVKNGKIFIEGKEQGKIPTTPFPTHINIDKADDWLIGYVDQEGFHIDRLIDDDFFSAIKLLFNAKHYVSAMKLLMICVDTMAFLEFDDIQGNFVKWLNDYADLYKINVTSEELWEFRNSILHMTNLDSRKVKSNKVIRLNWYVAPAGFKGVELSDEGKHFNFKSLVDIIAVAIAKWTNTFNTQKEKLEVFINRYDRVISDKRMTTIYHHNELDKQEE
jgi:hypothetical protein